MSTLGSAGGLGEKPATRWRGGSDLDGKLAYELTAGRVIVLSRKWQAAINWGDRENRGVEGERPSSLLDVGLLFGAHSRGLIWGDGAELGLSTRPRRG